jgi:hypothetical protein
MTSRPSERPSRAARFALRAAYASAGLAAALSVGGCPNGAELEDPDRFPQYAGAGAGGATGGTGGATGGTGGAGGATGGSAGMQTGGAAGSPAGAGGVAGTGGSGAAGLCDVQVALSKSCARTGCHSALDHYANLDLSNPANAAQLVGKMATYGDINCAMPGMPFRACTAAELPAACVPNTPLIAPSRADFDSSWVAKKLSGMDTGCGDPMPLPPGDSVSNGWNEARRLCLLDFFRNQAAP